MTRYVIVWRSRLSEISGRGSLAVDDPETAQKAADFLNGEHPNIEHWVETEPVRSHRSRLGRSERAGERDR